MGGACEGHWGQRSLLWAVTGAKAPGAGEQGTRSCGSAGSVTWLCRRVTEGPNRAWVLPPH